MFKFWRWHVLFLLTSTMVIYYVLLSVFDFLTIDKGFSTSRKFSSYQTPFNEQLTGMKSLDNYLKKRGFTNEQIERMSSLGKWLLAPEDTVPLRRNAANKTYLILIWKHGSYLERRHIKRFTSNKFSPWDQCSVQNCTLTYDAKNLHKADAIVFHLHLTKNVSELPTRNRTDQRWVFLTDESPMNTFVYGKQKLSDYDGLFNWSMSYRMDSDVPVPYGRTVRYFDDVSNNYKYWENIVKILWTKTKLVAVMGSNCGARNNRWSYVKKLKSSLHDELDIIGKCLDGNRTICLGHFDRDCAALKNYKFYLSFENSNCREYLTEKVFWNAYNKFAVPIIMGASREDCRRLLPPHSYLHVEDFANADAIAHFLRYLDRDEKRYFSFHEWRIRYRVNNEHGYFGSASKHYCRICEALHYNSEAPKVYEKLEDFWDKSRDCNSMID